MIQLLLRIAARYLVVPLAISLAVWLGMPHDEAVRMIDTITADPDVLMVLSMIVPAAVAAIEGWYLWIRNRGGPT